MTIAIGLLVYVFGLLTGVVLSHVQQRRLDDQTGVRRRGDWPGRSAEQDRAIREMRQP